MKKILFTGGGTLGHIYPAISFIRKIKEKYPNTYIIYFATTKDQKYSVLKEPLIDEIHYFEVSGIPIQSDISFCFIIFCILLKM